MAFSEKLMKGIFGPYVLWPLNKKLIFWIVTRVSARDYTVPNNWLDHFLDSRAQIHQIFAFSFGKIEDAKKSFWDELTFQWYVIKLDAKISTL